jgi:hypothetical protein
MYSHLSAAVAAERTDDDVYRAHLHRRARQSTEPSTLEITTPATAGQSGRTARVPWRRRVGRQHARPARA